MHAIAGLGNPGEEYLETRHNVGFWVVRELARRWRLEWNDAVAVASTARGRIAEQGVVLIEPRLYMNRSGDALAQLNLRVDPNTLIVLHDDVDLVLGSVRVKRGGGSGGHRGVASIIEHFGADFTRVRLGIGKPQAGMETAEHVLSRFDETERSVVASAVRRAADATECVLQKGAELAMSRFNVRRVVAEDLGSTATES